MRRLIYLLGFAAAFLILYKGNWHSPAASANPAVFIPSRNAAVTRVIDGDSLVIQGGEEVRLVAINAPEINEPCHDAASGRLSALVLNKKIILEGDTRDRDVYGRLLRYVFLNGENINTKMVRDGLATADIFPADIRYSEDIRAEEAQAVSSHTGCKWSGF